MAMLRLAIFAALLGLSLGARHLLTLQKGVQAEQREFDDFRFVREWPGTFCSTRFCPVEDTSFHFTIHGLWPNYADGTWPQFCDKNYPFDEDELSDLEGDMEDEWPSFFGDDDDFWDHEWERHGTCALNVLPDEHSYFKTVLQLHEKYDLAAALSASGIVPSSTKKYPAADLASAIKEMYGAQPLIHCKGAKLSEIWMCIGRDFQPFDCDASKDRSTCRDVLIPPIPGSKNQEEAEDRHDNPKAVLAQE